MSTWTAIPTSVLEVGQPIRSIDIIALRDNILAVPAGAAGAPRVQGAALANPLTMPGNLLTMTGNLRVENTHPETIWRETDQALPAGLWRVVLEGNRWHVQRNTAAAGDFSTVVQPIVVQSDDRVRLAHGLTIHDSSVTVTGTAPFFGCRAWINLHGGTRAIRGSGNVSSVTGTHSHYNVNFITAMPHAGFCILDCTGHSGGANASQTQRFFIRGQNATGFWGYVESHFPNSVPAGNANQEFLCLAVIA